MINEYEPAFPTTNWGNQNENMHGLTIRQHFAAMAMQGRCVDPKTSIEDLAKEAVRIADALINELNKTK